MLAWMRQQMQPNTLWAHTRALEKTPSLPCSRISLMIWPPLTWVCWRRVSVYVLHGTSAHKMPFSAMKLEMQPRIVLSGGCWFHIALLTVSGSCRHWNGLYLAGWWRDGDTGCRRSGTQTHGKVWQAGRHTVPSKCHWHTGTFTLRANVIFSSAGWAFHISWSNALCVCVCLNVNHAGTNHNRCTQRPVILRVHIY